MSILLFSFELCLADYYRRTYVADNVLAIFFWIMHIFSLPFQLSFFTFPPLIVTSSNNLLPKLLNMPFYTYLTRCMEMKVAVYKFDCVALGAYTRHMFLHFCLTFYNPNPTSWRDLFFDIDVYVVDIFEAEDKHLPIRKSCVWEFPRTITRFW